MHSPFYISDQKLLYPHRTTARLVDEIYDAMVSLVAREITTEEELRSKPMKFLQNNYFPMAHWEEIHIAFEKPIYIHTLWDINEMLMN